MKYKIALAVLLSVGASSSFGGTPADSCEDLSFRQYRADLAPIGIRIHNVESLEFGNHQLAELSVKNVGTIKVGSNGDGQSFNVAPIRVRIGQHVADGYVDLPVQVGAIKKVFLKLPVDAIEHCDVLDVKIDLAKTAKQKGCDCFDNDERELRAFVVGEASCRQLH